MEFFWYVVLMGILAVYIVLDGYDFGAGIIHLFLAKDEKDKKAITNAIGPFWDANEVWIIAAGGVLFFAFPTLYASSFSGFYLPLIMILWLLIFRAIGLEMRGQVHHPMWEVIWDKAFGIALANTTQLGFSKNIEQGGDSFSERLSLFPYFVYSIEKEKEWNYYKNLNRFLYWPFGWIVPRFIIPDKPKSDTGTVLCEKLFGYNTNSLTVTTYGWAYLEGGYIYVFILFLLFGLIICYFQYNLGFDNLYGLLLYIAILIALLKIESDIYFTINGILQKAMIYYIFYKILIKETSLNISPDEK